MLEIAATQPAVRRALEAVSGKELTLRRENGKMLIGVPDFSVMACVALEQAVR